MHELQALIGTESSVVAVKQFWPVARSRELTPGLFIVPIDPTLSREISGTEFRVPDLEDDNVERHLENDLRPLLDPLKKLASKTPLALIFTQYSGGLGNQLAVLLTENGCFGPLLGPNAINQVLERLGIRPDDENKRDAFSLAGLERWRSTEDLTREVG
jgi:hypothetical protein